MITKNLQIALFFFRHNPLRSFLTMIGIIVGIAAVVAVLSIGKGNEAKIEAEIRKIGSSLFWIEPLARPAAEPGKFYSAPIQLLTIEDAAAIALNASAVKWSSPVSLLFASGAINGKSTQFSIVATTPQYSKVKSLSLLSGRYLSDIDLIRLNPVCIIEETPGIHFLANLDPSLEIQGHKLKIIGMTKREITNDLPGRPLTVYISISTAAQRFVEGYKVHKIYCTARDGSLNLAIDQVKDILRSRNQGRLNFQIRTPREFFQSAQNLTRTATLVTAGIGMLSLLVGGIGIMNVLLASVLERTKEIGILRAVGAKKRDILFQFLLESISLSVIGGLLGVTVGLLASKFMSFIIDLPMVISLDSIFSGIIFSGVVGLIFGVFPAWKAATLNPIEALHYH